MRYAGVGEITGTAIRDPLNADTLTPTPAGSLGPVTPRLSPRAELGIGQAREGQTTEYRKNTVQDLGVAAAVRPAAHVDDSAVAVENDGIADRDVEEVDVPGWKRSSGSACFSRAVRDRQALRFSLYRFASTLCSAKLDAAPSRAGWLNT